MLNATEFDYKPFLKEAYLDPIRTVTVIDDEYPTLDGLLSRSKEDYKKDDLDRLKDIINVCRGSEYNWLLDVYDGKEDTLSEDKVAGRLHHSDLLILDYHLDGEDDGFCLKSVNIIKNLSNNRHFNIVAVHTKGYIGSKGTVQDVLVDILVSLQQKPSYLNLSVSKLKDINEAIDDWELGESSIKTELEESISTLDFLTLIREFSGEILRPVFSHDLLERVNQLIDEVPDDINIDRASLLKWIFQVKFAKYEQVFATKTAKHYDWGIDGETNWVKTEDLFLTVIGKKTIPVIDIPQKLLFSLEKWRPHPHKLILSKLRNEIESNGTSASSNILNRKYLQAAWLNELIKTATDNETKTAIWSTISKLWEELSTEIKPNIGDFTLKLLTHFKDANLDENAILEYFIETKTLENKNEQIKHANCFSCSRAVSSHHLLTGHILKFDSSFWLCLTPICDLVPGQKKSKNDGQIEKVNNELMPITLVQMFEAKDSLKLTREGMCKRLNLDQNILPTLNAQEEAELLMDYSTENNMLFIQPGGKEKEIKILSFTVGLDGKANPKTKEFYAEEQGVFTSNKIKLHIAEPCSKGLTLEKKAFDAEVVAELRYEYALNLLSRLGFSKSRVGLDFIKS